MNDRRYPLLLAALPAAWLLLRPLSAHELTNLEPEEGQRISRALAVDQRIRADGERQESLDSEQQNAIARRHDDSRYYWWWPFRR